MNTTGFYFNLCSIKLQQKNNALAKSFDAILAQAVEESINPHLLRLELLGTPALSSRRKVHPWNAFLHEEAKGKYYSLYVLYLSIYILCTLILFFFFYKYIYITL
ncbi:hypothetical protein BC941DRAFT_108644 [Chlamydoabsidia padenii]|nr:hypothetical protein BC941DRAFT_108644 [Chlamydoabsidia padenii]